MSSDLAPSDWDRRYRLARLDAKDGYGWADLVVRYGLTETQAKLLVMEAEYARLAKTQDAKP